MIDSIVSHLVKKLKENKSVNDFFSDFTDATVSWLRPVFLTDDDQPKEIITKLQEKTDSEPRQKSVKNAIEVALEDNPAAKEQLIKMLETLNIRDTRDQTTVSVEGKDHIVLTKIEGSKVKIKKGK